MHIRDLALVTLQVRECATALMRVAKATRVPIFVVGHVTKDGEIAGAHHIDDVATPSSTAFNTCFPASEDMRIHWHGSYHIVSYKSDQS